MIGFFTLDIFSQEVELSGLVIDSLQNNLENANVFAIPYKKENKIKFSITDHKGNYTLKLKQGIGYSLEVSFLGYKSYKDSIRLKENIFKKIILFPSSEALEEVILTERISVKVREDTITYRPEKFLTGEERKLRDVLKKLPGLDVDRSGNVKVNGKEVTKLLIDGKEFFTGDEKLGVNNIPADVIDEIEALDNYNEVSFLKGLSGSEQLALNIKLKDGKKKFAFGSVELGGGVKDRYTVNPVLFYYSPKTSVNAIADFNNTGNKAFTTQDYINFEGGFSRFSDDPASYLRLFNDDFAQFLSQDNFIFNRNNFGAFSINQKINSTLDLNGYSIFSGNTLETRQENSLTYLSNQNIDEDRETTQNNDLFFSLTKLGLHYTGKNNLDIKYEAFLKTNSGEAATNIQSLTLADTTFVDQQNKPSFIDFTQNVSINKQFSKKHTTSINTSYKYLDSDNRNVWQFNQPIFGELIPLEIDQETILLNQNRSNALNEFKFNLKHYWVLNRFHHFYPEVGVNTLNQNYQTIDNQAVASGLNDFNESGFNNNLEYGLTESYIGLHYKVKTGKFIFKSGLFYHYYDWNIQQFDETLRNTGKAIILPQLSIDWGLKSSNKLKFKYNLLSQFGEASQFANRLRLQSFNQLFSGNPNLENEIYQRVSLTYSKFSLFKGNLFNAGFVYNNRIKSIRNNTFIEGIDRINTLIFTSLPENSYNGNFSFTKLLEDYKITLRGNASLFDYSRIINNTTQDFQSINYGYSVKGITNFKKAPNIELEWRQNFNVFDALGSSNRFTQITPSIGLEYRFLKDFVIKNDYSYTYYENKDRNEINRFSIGNASLLYAKEDSPWSIEIEASNIFDTRFRNENSFSQFLISDSRTFIQPRIILLKLAYSF